MQLTRSSGLSRVRFRRASPKATPVPPSEKYWLTSKLSRNIGHPMGIDPWGGRDARARLGVAAQKCVIDARQAWGGDILT